MLSLSEFLEKHHIILYHDINPVTMINIINAINGNFVLQDIDNTFDRGQYYNYVGLYYANEKKELKQAMIAYKISVEYGFYCSYNNIAVQCLEYKDEVIEYLQKGIDHNCPFAHYNMGTIIHWRENKDYETATKFMRKAIDMCGNNEMFIVGYIIITVAAEKELSQELINHFLSFDKPTYKDLRSKLGDYYTSIKDDRYIDEYKIAADRGNKAIILIMSSYYYENNNFEEMKKYIMMFNKLVPDLKAELPNLLKESQCKEDFIIELYELFNSYCDENFESDALKRIWENPTEEDFFKLHKLYLLQSNKEKANEIYGRMIYTLDSEDFMEIN